MMQKASLLIVEDSRDITRVSRSILCDKGFGVISCRKDGLEVLEAIEIYNPDVVIIEMYMANLDAVATIKALSDKKLLRRPKIIVTSNFDNGLMQRDVLKAGADYFLLKPFDYDMLCDRIQSLLVESISVSRCDERVPIDEIDLEVTVTDMLHRVGVPANLKGYHFLRTAIMLAVEDNDILNRITKELYPSVADRHRTTPQRVERSIRNAIESAWDRGDIDVLDYYFGHTTHRQRSKPTNSEFIAILSDKIRLKIRVA